MESVDRFTVAKFYGISTVLLQMVNNFGQNVLLLFFLFFSVTFLIYFLQFLLFVFVTYFHESMKYRKLKVKRSDENYLPFAAKLY